MNIIKNKIITVFVLITITFNCSINNCHFIISGIDKSQWILDSLADQGYRQSVYENILSKQVELKGKREDCIISNIGFPNHHTSYEDGSYSLFYYVSGGKHLEEKKCVVLKFNKEKMFLNANLIVP